MREKRVGREGLEEPSPGDATSFLSLLRTLPSGLVPRLIGSALSPYLDQRANAHCSLNSGNRVLLHHSNDFVRPRPRPSSPLLPSLQLRHRGGGCVCVFVYAGRVSVLAGHDRRPPMGCYQEGAASLP